MVRASRPLGALRLQPQVPRRTYPGFQIEDYKLQIKFWQPATVMHLRFCGICGYLLCKAIPSGIEIDPLLKYSQAFFIKGFTADCRPLFSE
jgi:hypothetical protein